MKPRSVARPIFTRIPRYRLRYRGSQQPTAFALARGHCFPDGNKRVALAITDVFLRMNGLELAADEMDAVDTIQSPAAGELTEDQLADWISANSSSLR